MGKFEQATNLAILAAGRRPEWVEPAGWDGAPAVPSAGVYLNDSIVTIGDVALRAETHRRTATITVTTADLNADYSVTLNGDTTSVTGPFADVATLLSDLADAVNGMLPLHASATASTTALVVTGLDQDDFSIDVAATGTGVLACEADACTATVVVWATYQERTAAAPTGWRHPFDASYAIDWSGFSERFSTGGLDRLYLEVRDLAGHVDDGATVTLTDPAVRIGPCVTE